MPLLGTAAMLLSFDVEAAAIAEHDRWHTQEHLPERLSIPGFLRGTRWVCTGGGPRYLVIYEVRDLDTLSSAPYLARLDQPSAWTARLMPHYRHMRRGFCAVLGSVGRGTGQACALLRFTPDAAGLAHRWLLADAMPGLPSQPGLASAHLLQGRATAPMTAEQRLRGPDAGVDSAVLVTGYDPDAVGQAGRAIAQGLVAQGVADTTVDLYRFDATLDRAEIDAEIDAGGDPS